MMLLRFVGAACEEVPGLRDFLETLVPHFSSATLDADGALVLTGKKSKTFAKDEVLAALRDYEAEQAVPLLFRLCSAYDHHDETNAWLLRYVKHRWTEIEPTFFYVHPRVKLLCAEIETTRMTVKPSKDIELRQTESSIVVLLKSSAQLQRALCKRLERVA